MAKTRRKTSLCPNCGRGLLTAENYCPDCGQENTNRNVSLKIFLKDFADDFLDFDSRFFKTIRPFLLKPGFLTKEYNEGRRKLYFPPLRLYLLCSFLYFIIPAPDLLNSNITVGTEIPDTLYSVEKHDTVNKKNFHFGFTPDRKGMTIVARGDTLKKKYTYSEKDSIVNLVMDSLKLDKETMVGRILMRGGKNLLSIIDDGGKEYMQKLKDNTPGMVFCLLPLFALLLKLVYLKKKILYMEAVIFSLHFHAFAFLLFIMEDLLAHAGLNAGIILPVEFLFTLCYLYYGLKRYFEQKFLTTAWKLFVIGTGYSVAFVLTAVITLVVTLFMF